jgi:uncharacterized protein DUF4136
MIRRSVTAVAMALAMHAVLTARMDVRVEYDKTFDFKPMRTWAWNPQGPGEVKMARTKDDDPEAMHQRTMPLIVEAVSTTLEQRGLKTATGEPDLTVTYYLLLTTSMSAQTLGQFLPATTAWGLPPFAPATQSMKLMNRGSLVIDLSAKQTVVWRGVAQANVKFDADEARRQALIREAVRDLLRRYPPRR